MSKIIAIANQKGGVGKTTTCINLSAALARLGKKVLLIDMDSQANATTGLGVESDQTVYHVLLEGLSPREAILEPYPGLFILPSSIELAGGAVELVYLPRREYRLCDALKDIRDNYDFIFIDCPPSLGLLTVNSLVAADACIIPLQCEFFAMEGLGKLADTIKRVKANFNPALEIEGIILTMFDPRTKLAHEVVREVREYFGKKVFDTLIPRNVALAEAPSYGKPCIFYDASSRGTKAYLALAEEFIKRNMET